ncbi:Ribosomal large subunit pseudouridine synthase D [Porphyromonas levii]|nr:Ribosomal large subunit pseudouridine synthase D [Porphyromonas levii]MBR8730038.1 Ribosomal large subunit pseudouridine synthase D [Porphyromonas levii]MBR8731734.1 Ribosomal large subunit pseudouridine synthase D [Porphyromonas levii]
MVLTAGNDDTSAYQEEELWELETLDEMDDSEDGASVDAPTLFEHFSCVVDKGQTPLRIDRFLVDRMPKVSRNRIQQAAEAGALFVGDKAVRANYKVRPGEVISLRLERPPYELEIRPEPIPLSVVYEDEYLMVVNKPAGLVVHPGHGNYTGTLLNALAYHLKDDPRYDPNDPEVGLVHRIDKDTSGLLLIAKEATVRTALARQFFEKTTRREYLALVWGRMPEEEGTVRTNLGRDPKDRMVMTTFPYGGDEGKTAVTHYRVEEELGYVSLIRCKLETGRTHQIRAHVRSLGHPIFNDERYGGAELLRGNRFASYRKFVENCFALCPRQALHAQTLGFYHPVKKEQMDFTSELPEDMGALLEKWRRYVAAGVITAENLVDE